MTEYEYDLDALKKSYFKFNAVHIFIAYLKLLHFDVLVLIIFYLFKIAIFGCSTYISIFDLKLLHLDVLEIHFYFKLLYLDVLEIY